ncbi:hypothetical protein DFH08DRAFT_802374 [Mycena albidolilacea]|uniref:ABC transmembrane type-1 domain-containing protein n=1 Tax=Mycena albidolilacea TaxID=1033008 RepID=A0AAD7F0V9_9AGAR|nr:hypothetical protein DFH08DRAFT_802374 [Mycena albidolilacea]
MGGKEEELLTCVNALLYFSSLDIFDWLVDAASHYARVIDISQRVIVLKDKATKEAHTGSAQVAYEAASSVRTVAALTGEEYCCSRYSNSLLRPLQDVKHAALRSSLLYALSQTTVYWVIALAFWYGSVLVSQEITTVQFFVTLMAFSRPTAYPQAMFGSMNAGSYTARNVFSFAPDLSTAQTAGKAIMQLLESGPGIPPHSKNPGKDSEKTQGLFLGPAVAAQRPSSRRRCIIAFFVLFTLPPTYCQRDELNRSSGISGYAGDRFRNGLVTHIRR